VYAAAATRACPAIGMPLRCSNVKLRLAAVSLVSSVLLGGCGVAFGDPPQGNEFFVSLEVTGPKRVQAELTAAVAYEQYYPVDVVLQCFVVRNKKAVRQIGEEMVRAHPAGNPDATPYPGNFAFDFSVDEVGTYSIECLTPDDEDNIIAEEFTISGEALPTPTPPFPGRGEPAP
jgi:hypothetical protein